MTCSEFLTKPPPQQDLKAKANGWTLCLSVVLSEKINHLPPCKTLHASMHADMLDVSNQEMHSQFLSCRCNKTSECLYVSSDTKRNAHFYLREPDNLHLSPNVFVVSIGFLLTWYTGATTSCDTGQKLKLVSTIQLQSVCQTYKLETMTHHSPCPELQWWTWASVSHWLSKCWPLLKDECTDTPRMNTKRLSIVIRLALQSEVGISWIDRKFAGLFCGSLESSNWARLW